jgi:hypothetical protein
MRAELAAAVGGLISNASTEEYRPTSTETERLIKLADIVTWARSGVERDYRGDIADVHALEMPTRFGKQLAQLMRGAVAIGMAPSMAMRLATRCARDSIMPLRRTILLDVAAHPNTRPREVARRIVRPPMTVDRELQALHLLGALGRNEQDVMQSGRELTLLYYHLAPALDRQLLLSM